MKNINYLARIFLLFFLVNVYPLFSMECQPQKLINNNPVSSAGQPAAQIPNMRAPAQPEPPQFRLATLDELNTVYQAHPERRAYDEALDLIQSGRKQETVDILSQLASSEKPHAFAQFSMGNIMFDEGDRSSAEMYWSMCSHPFAKDFLARFYLENGRKEEALQILRQTAQPCSVPVNLYDVLGRLVFAETKMYYHQPAIQLLRQLEAEAHQGLMSSKDQEGLPCVQQVATRGPEDVQLEIATDLQSYQEKYAAEKRQKDLASLRDRAFRGEREAFKQLVISAQTEVLPTDESLLHEIISLLEEGRFSLDKGLYSELNELAKKKKDKKFNSILGKSLLTSGQRVPQANAKALKHLCYSHLENDSWYLALANFKNGNLKQGIRLINQLLYPYPESMLIIQQNLQFLEEAAKKYSQAAFVLYRIYKEGIEGKVEADEQKATKFLDIAVENGYESAILEREKHKKKSEPKVLYDLLTKIRSKKRKTKNNQTLTKIYRETQEFLIQLANDNFEACYYIFREKSQSDIEDALTYFARAEEMVTPDNFAVAQQTGALEVLQQASRSSVSALKVLADFYYKRARSGNATMADQATRSYQELLERVSRSSAVTGNTLSFCAVSGLDKCARELHDANALGLLLGIYSQGLHGVAESSDALLSLVEYITSESAAQSANDGCLQVLTDFVQASDNQELQLAVGKRLLGLNGLQKWQKYGESLVGRVAESGNEEALLLVLEQWCKQKENHGKFIKLFEQILAAEQPSEDLVVRGRGLLERMSLEDSDIVPYLASLYERGCKGFTHTDKKEAFGRYQQLAKTNYLAALYCGRMCLQGDGVQQDDAKALKFLTMAFNQCPTDNETSLALIKDDLQQLHERKNTGATCVLFRMLVHGSSQTRSQIFTLLNQALDFLKDLQLSLFTVLKEGKVLSDLERLSKTDLSAKCALGLIFYEHARKNENKPEEIDFLIKCEPLLRDSLEKADEIDIVGAPEDRLRKHLGVIQESLANHFMSCGQLEEAEPYVVRLCSQGEKRPCYYLSRLLIAREDDEMQQRKGYEHLVNAADCEVDALLALADHLICQPEMCQKFNISKEWIIKLLKQERECSLNERLYIQRWLQQLDGNALSVLDGNLASRLSSAVQSEDPEAFYSLGLAYYLNQQYDKAFENFQKAAQRGHRYAAARMGIMYQVGSGVEASPEKALECFATFLSDPTYDPVEESSFDQVRVSNAIIDGLTIMKDRPKASKLLIFNKLNLFKKTCNHTFLNDALLLFESAIAKKTSQGREQTQQALQEFQPIFKEFQQYIDEIATVPFTCAACYISAGESGVEIFDVPYNKKNYTYQALQLLEKAKEMTKPSATCAAVDGEFVKIVNNLLAGTVVAYAHCQLEDNGPQVVISLFEDMIKKYPELQALPVQFAHFYLTGHAGCTGEDAKRKGFTTLEIHAEKGNPLAAKELAKLYKDGVRLSCGVTVSKHTTRRLQYLEIAAQSDADANIELGDYFKREARKLDFKKTEHYYKKAKELGSVEGCKKLGQLYFEQNRFQEAAQELSDSCLEKDPLALILKAGIASRCIEEIAVEKALDYFEKVLDSVEEKMEYEVFTEIVKIGLINYFSALQHREPYRERTKWLLARYYCCGTENVRSIKSGPIDDPSVKQVFNEASRFLLETLIKCHDPILKQRAEFLRWLLALNKDVTRDSVQKCVSELCQLIESHDGYWDPFILRCIKKVDIKITFLMMNSELQEDRKFYNEQFETLNNAIVQKGFDIHLRVDYRATRESSNNSSQ